MSNQCEFHGHWKLNCPDCRREERERVRQGIRNGTLTFGVFKWTGDGRYPLMNALRTFKIRSAAERYAERNELVVRTVPTGDGAT
jgi:hypothetical protein